MKKKERRAKRSLLDSDVHFVVHAQPHRLTTNHTDRDFRRNGTVPDDMEHDGTALQARDYETAALLHYYPLPRFDARRDAVSSYGWLCRLVVWEGKSVQPPIAGHTQ